MSANPELSAQLAATWLYVAMISSVVLTICGFILGTGRDRWLRWASLALAVFCWWLYAVFQIGATGKLEWHIAYYVLVVLGMLFGIRALYRVWRPL